MKVSSYLIGSVAVVVVLVLGFVLTAQAANAATPSSPVYFLDKSWESIVRISKFDEAAVAEYEMSLLDERLEELAEMEEGTAEDDDISKALDEIDEQQTRVTKRVEDCENSDVSEAEKTRIRSMYETKTQEQTQEMEQVQESYELKNEGEDSQISTKMQQSLDELKSNLKQNDENGNSDDINQQGSGNNDNSNSSGNK